MFIKGSFIGFFKGLPFSKKLRVVYISCIPVDVNGDCPISLPSSSPTCIPSYLHPVQVVELTVSFLLLRKLPLRRMGTILAMVCSTYQWLCLCLLLALLPSILLVPMDTNFHHPTPHVVLPPFLPLEQSCEFS